MFTLIKMSIDILYHSLSKCIQNKPMMCTDMMEQIWMFTLIKMSIDILYHNLSKCIQNKPMMCIDNLSKCVQDKSLFCYNAMQCIKFKSNVHIDQDVYCQSKPVHL